MVYLLESIVKFIKNTITHLIDLIYSVQASIEFALTVMDSFFPVELIVIFGVILAAAVAFKIIGREG